MQAHLSGAAFAAAVAGRHSSPRISPRGRAMRFPPDR